MFDCFLSICTPVGLSAGVATATPQDQSTPGDFRFARRLRGPSAVDNFLISPRNHILLVQGEYKL